MLLDHFFHDVHQIDYDSKWVDKVQVCREQFILHQKHNGSHQHLF